MTVDELYQILNEKIPPSLSCSWDNDGLMCCPNGDKELHRVLIVLDVTADAVQHAIEGGFDLILSHHPMIFKGLPSVTEKNYTADKVIRLIQNGISVMSFHTRLDAVSGGVNDVLAELLGLVRTESFGSDGEAVGRIGFLPEPMAVSTFAEKIKELLGAPTVFLSDAGKPVSRVAVLGGSGGDDLAAAMAAGADTYLSGNLGYHQMVDAPEMGINLIEAGHFYTENPVCQRLCTWLHSVAPDVVCELYNSNRIRSL